MKRYCIKTQLSPFLKGSFLSVMVHLEFIVHEKSFNTKMFIPHTDRPSVSHTAIDISHCMIWPLTAISLPTYISWANPTHERHASMWMYQIHISIIKDPERYYWNLLHEVTPWVETHVWQGCIIVKGWKVVQSCQGASHPQRSPSFFCCWLQSSLDATETL